MQKIREAQEEISSCASRIFCVSYQTFGAIDTALQNAQPINS
ncbi:MAG: hypothetical protein SOY99_02480 [Alloprevotella sp.]|nr:hypothetical protein [Alloprevotella sp.]